jgi:hypothetical protein
MGKHIEDPYSGEGGPMGDTGNPISELGQIKTDFKLDQQLVAQMSSGTAQSATPVFDASVNPRVYDAIPHEYLFAWARSYSSAGSDKIRGVTALNGLGGDLNINGLTPDQRRLALKNHIVPMGIVSSAHENHSTLQGGTLQIGGMHTVPLDHYGVTAGARVVLDLPPDGDASIFADNVQFDAPNDKKRMCVRMYRAEDSICELASAVRFFLSKPAEFVRAMGKQERTWSLRNAVRDMIQNDMIMGALMLKQLLDYGIIGAPALPARTALPAGTTVDDYAFEVVPPAASLVAGLQATDNVFTTARDPAKRNALYARNEQIVERIFVLMKWASSVNNFTIENNVASAARRSRYDEVNLALLASLFWSDGDVDAEYGTRTGNTTNAKTLPATGEPLITTVGGYLLEAQKNLPTRRAHTYIEAIHRQSMFNAGVAYTSGRKGQSAVVVS